ncbi:MAG: hypothetical protein ACRCZF_23835, partial [Gemmataceae bacterium]
STLTPPIQEHRYYYARGEDGRPTTAVRPKMRGYTAVIGPYTEQQLQNMKTFTIELVNVSQHLDSVWKPLVLELPPSPVGGPPTTQPKPTQEGYTEVNK